MTDRELRRMSRAKLAEYILFQDREIRRLRDELDAAEKELEDRTVSAKDPGDLSETGAQILEQLKKTQETADRCMAALERILKEEGDGLPLKTEL